MKYTFDAVVTRQVIDKVVLTVKASSPDEAEQIARRTLQNFPEESFEPDVTKCMVMHREYQEPQEVELTIG